MTRLATFTLALMLVLGSIGCGKSDKVMSNDLNSAAKVEQKAENVKIGSHLCGANTKANKPCTRKVSDAHGKDAKCFQHRS